MSNKLEEIKLHAENIAFFVAGLAFAYACTQGWIVL